MGWRRVLPGRDSVPTGCERALQLLFLLSRWLQDDGQRFTANPLGAGVRAGAGTESTLGRGLR